MQATVGGGHLQTTAYAISYYLNLYSDFTFFLNDPVNGDQFEQYDNRKIYGWNGSWSRADTMFGYPMQNSVGWDIRQDRIDPVGLYDTVQRQRLDTVREDNVRETSYSLWLENQTQWNDWFRSIVGIRGENYHFDVDSNIPENSGSKTAGMGLPKLSLVFGPWQPDGVLRQCRRRLSQQRCARRRRHGRSRRRWSRSLRRRRWCAPRVRNWVCAPRSSRTCNRRSRSGI